MGTTLFFAAVAAIAGIVRAVIAYLEYRKRAGPALVITAAEVRRFLERPAVVLERLQVRGQLVLRIGLSA